MTTQQKDAPLVQEEMIEEWFESAWFYGHLSPEEWKQQLRAFATELLTEPCDDDDPLNGQHGAPKGRVAHGAAHEAAALELAKVRYADGAAAERERIVKWLRERAREISDASPGSWTAADIRTLADELSVANECERSEHELEQEKDR